MDAMVYFENRRNRGRGRQTTSRTVDIGRAGVAPQNWVGTHTQNTEVRTMCDRNGREVSQSEPHPEGLSQRRGRG